MQHQCHRGDQRGGGAVGGARGEAGAGAEGDAVGGYQCAGGGPGRDAGNAVSKGGVRGRMVRQGRNLEKTYPRKEPYKLTAGMICGWQLLNP
jgi:hypothetical protein